jgi:hypothetical protein
MGYIRVLLPSYGQVGERKLLSCVGVGVGVGVGIGYCYKLTQRCY